jgi:hypothetical protein
MHESRVHLLVQALVTRQLGYLERVEGVRKRGRRRVREPGRLDHPLRVPVNPGSVAALEVGARQAVLGVFRVEEEGQPLDLRAEPTLEPLGPREADVAERSGVVAPDRDGQRLHVNQATGGTIRFGNPSQL